MLLLRQFIIRLGRTTHPLIIVALIVALNVSWVVTLGAFGSLFQQVSGYQPIDLQNTSSILTASQAVEQIKTYSTTARSLYWVFFVLDNIMPPLTFGAFALLWVVSLSRSKWPLFARLLNSPFILIPFGVGLFDWIENLFFITAVSSTTGDITPIMEAGLFFVRLKAIVLFATFGITLLLTGYTIAAVIWLRLNRVRQQNSVSGA